MKRILTSLVAIIVALTAAAAPRAEVSLLTCMEGSDIYELEGHTGLRIRFDNNQDMTVNWGVFDFNSPGFVYRFVKGETDYLAAAFPTDLFLDSYRADGRAVYEQTLALDSLQTERLMELIFENLRPENRVYRYNYVLDNCATRPLALIERALGDTLTLSSPGVPASERNTFRNAMRHFHANYPWYQFGIDTALGSGIDRPVSEREASFAPVMLADMLAGATTSTGTPIVRSSQWLVGGPDTPSASLGPTPLALTPLFWGWAVFAIAFTVTILQMRGMARRGRWFDTVYFAVLGLSGLLLTFLIFVSVHEATSPNWLYLWLNPLCFIGAVAPWLKKGKRLEFCYQSVNFALLIVLGVLLALGVQSPNPAFIPLMAASALRAAAAIKQNHRGKVL